MSKVVDIRSKQRTMEGPCVCLNCHHKWVGVFECGSVAFECPECGLFKGVLTGVTHPPYAFVCDCGCMHFFLDPNGCICAHCGAVANLGD